MSVPEKKRYVYHLELIYIYPGTYSPGKLNEINEAIFDLQKNKNDMIFQNVNC